MARTLTSGSRLAVLLTAALVVLSAATFAACSSRADAAVIASARGACLGQGDAAAATFRTSGGNHLIVLAQDGADEPWTDAAPVEWRPRSVDDLELIACVDATDRVVRRETCVWNGADVDRVWTERDARVVDARTASLVVRFAVAATPRPDCEIDDVFVTTQLREDVPWPLFVEHLRSLVVDGVFIDPDPTPGSRSVTSD